MLKSIITRIRLAIYNRSPEHKAYMDLIDNHRRAMAHHDIINRYIIDILDAESLADAERIRDEAMLCISSHYDR